MQLRLNFRRRKNLVTFEELNIREFKDINFKWDVPDGPENENNNYIISIYTVLSNDMQEDNNKKSIPGTPQVTPASRDIYTKAPAAP